MNVLLDTNVLLDVLFRREPFLASAADLWRACQDGRLSGHISAVTVTSIYYIGRRAVGREAATAGVATCLAAFRVLPTDHNVLAAAVQLPGNDFEDKVQIATAVSARLDAIVTRDRTGFSSSPIPVLSAADLLARLPPQ